MERGGRRATASGCIVRMCCSCCQWSRLPKRSVVTGNIFHCLRPPSHLLHGLIAGICGAEHGHQSFPLLGHSPASTFISTVLKRAMFIHSSQSDAAVTTLLSLMTGTFCRFHLHYYKVFNKISSYLIRVVHWDLRST